MSFSPLYALLCLQLAFAPAVMAVEPSWEAKRAEMAKDVKEALESLDKLDRAGPTCSENYLKSQCPRTMPDPPKRSFVETVRKHLKEVEKELAGVAPDAKIADLPFEEKQKDAVDACAGAGASSVADSNKRKAAVDKLNSAFTKVKTTLQGDLRKLFDSGPHFQNNLNACVKEVAGVFSMLAAATNLPKNAHEALGNLWSQDSKHPQCPRDALSTLHKLTGKNPADASSLMGSIAKNAGEYSANLASNSANLAKYAEAAGKKVDCKTAEGGQGTGKTGEAKKPGISGKPEEKPGTVAGGDPTKTPSKEKTPAQTDPAKPADEKKPDPAQVESTGKKPGEVAGKNPPSATRPVDTTVPDPKPSTPESPPAEQSAGLSKGSVVGGLAVLGVGAGAAYLIFSKKDKKSGGEDYTTVSTGTTSSTQTSSHTATNTTSVTSTKTSTSTGTGPVSSVPYTDTLTATSVTTGTATSSGTSTQTSTSSSTGTNTRE